MLPKFYLGVLVFGLSNSVWSSPLAIGDPSSTIGELKLSGWIRANIQDKDYSDNDHRLKFDAAKLNLDYKAKNLFGKLHYRCYQYDQICDFSSIVDANIGYNFDNKYKILAGLQPVAFGPDVGWSSSWWGGMLITAGLEDVHNVGLNFSSEILPNTQVDLGYFVKDGGDFVGTSKDSARYSANFVKPDQENEPYLKEKNMWIGRIKYQVPLNHQDMKLNVGGSYWYSDIDHSTTQGNRQSWATFGQFSYQNVNLTLTAGQNKIKGLDLDYATVGSFDMSYQVANKANFYTADINYTLDHLYQDWSLTPYATYSAYDKSDHQYADSTRYIVGAALNKQPFSVALEYIIGKNDPFIDGASDSLAQGTQNEWNRLLNLMFFYNF